MKFSMWRRGVAGAVAIVAVGGVARAATVTNVNLNFNGSDTFTSNFNQFLNNAVPTAAQLFTYSATAGVLDSGGTAGGGILAPADTSSGTGTTAFYKGGTADFTATQGGQPVQYTYSEMFLRTAGTNTNRPLQIGFGLSPSLGFNGANNQDFFSARVDANAAAGQDALEFQVQAANGTAGATVSLSRTPYNFTANHWYKVVGTFTETSVATGTFSLSGSVFDYGTDGVTVPAAPAVTINNTFTDAALANAGGSALNIGFRNNDNTLATQFDNFSIAATPEPASLGFLGLGALGLLARRRRA